MALLENIQTNHATFLENLSHRFLDEQRESALQKFEEKGFPPKKTRNTNTPTSKKSPRKIIIFSPQKRTTLQKKKLQNCIWEKKISTGLSLLMGNCRKNSRKLPSKM